MNGELKINYPRQSWALAASLFLHGLVLVCLGANATPGPGSDQNVLTVHLAIQTLEASQAPEIESFPKRKSLVKNAGQDEKDTKPTDLPKTEPEPATEIVESVALLEHQLNESKKQVIHTINPPEGEKQKPNTTIENNHPELPAGRLNHLSISPDDQNALAGQHGENLSDHGSPITDHQMPLLAFAGGPAALGMIARDIFVPDLVPAQPLSLPEPFYPVLSRKRGEEGRVVVEVTISAKGEVRSAKVCSSSSYPRLDRAALEASRRAAFRSAAEFGTPVESVIKVAYRFELEN